MRWKCGRGRPNFATGIGKRLKCTKHAETGVTMNEDASREYFDTGLRKIRTEIKTRLVPHGLFGSITDIDSSSADHALSGSRIEISIKGRTVSRAFGRQDIEGCR